MIKLRIIAIIFTILIIPNISLAKPLNDKSITNLVEKLLEQEKDIPNTNINITTKNGVVHISGNVDTHLQQSKIIELASSVKNVLDVETGNLSVKNSSQFLTDTLITAKAKGRIKYLDLNKNITKDYDLHVETTNNIVHIFGNVKNQKDIFIIKKAIMDIISVKDVKINIICNN